MSGVQLMVMLLGCIGYVWSADLWNYDLNSTLGPLYWNANFTQCNGSRQSPVNIDTSKVAYNKSLMPLTLSNYNSIVPDVGFDLENHVHSVWIAFDYNNTQNWIQLRHQGHTYRLLQFHFHWGKYDYRGSEHRFDDNAEAAEVHFVHYNEKYNNISTAVKYEDGLLVWGHLIEVKNDSSANHTGMQNLLQYFPNISRPGKHVTMTPFRISMIIPQNSTERYYTYSGSLTTPPCGEVVTWLLNPKKIRISQAQMDEFRNLYLYKNVSRKDKVVDNYRPPQPLNGRVVQSSFGAIITTTVSTIATTTPPMNGSATVNTTPSTTGAFIIKSTFANFLVTVIFVSVNFFQLL